ncbi:MAG: DegT/DnrJ/EryC1/StrS family aminotransferase [Herpetosiphon sp.]
MRIPFGDLSRQTMTMQPELEAAVLGVVRSGWYVLGPQVRQFEEAWAAETGATYAVAVGNGTDALHLTLRAAGVGAGDEVITAPNAGGYTSFALRLIGARPIYADIEVNRPTIDPADIERRIGARTKAIVAVHLYGTPADMPRLADVAQRHNIALIEDCAQAHGATSSGKPVGTWGLAGSWSFFPTKNLGALGDGGAVVTSNQHFATRVRQLRQYGWDTKYHATVPFGINSRLDEMQAAVLRVKLPHLVAWTERRRAIADRYRRALQHVHGVVLPRDVEGSVYHLFVVRIPGGHREAVQAVLTERGIGTAVHYPVLDQYQSGLISDGEEPQETPIAANASAEILSLPCFPELRDDEVDLVVEELSRALRHVAEGSARREID